MKKFAIVVAVLATLVGNSGYAQGTNGVKKKPMGNGAQTAGSYTSENFAWGIGLGALAVIGVVVGLTAGTASSTPSSFVH